jgi:hypothetical protein
VTKVDSVSEIRKKMSKNDQRNLKQSTFNNVPNHTRATPSPDWEPETPEFNQVLIDRYLEITPMHMCDDDGDLLNNSGDGELEPITEEPSFDDDGNTKSLIQSLNKLPKLGYSSFKCKEDMILANSNTNNSSLKKSLYANRNSQNFELNSFDSPEGPMEFIDGSCSNYKFDRIDNPKGLVFDAGPRKEVSKKFSYVSSQQMGDCESPSEVSYPVLTTEGDVSVSNPFSSPQVSLHTTPRDPVNTGLANQGPQKKRG